MNRQILAVNTLALSVYLPQYKNVRVWIEKNKDDLKGKTVTITGIGFIDIDHKYPRNDSR